MADYPGEFEFDIMLSDGRVVHLRPIRPDDADRLHRFFHRVGPQSIYQRFFRVKKDLSPEELRYFTTLDYSDRMAFVTTAEDEIVAVGRYDLMPDKSGLDKAVAEVAFLVQDDHQGKGIGRALLQHLTVYARTKGVTEFEAYVLADNMAMLRLFRNSGYRVEHRLEEDVWDVQFPIEHSPEARAAEWEYERRSVTASMTPIFFPRTVAVVGARPEPSALGGLVMRNIMMSGYTGIVYPVNSESGYVHSVRSYPAISDIPDDIDVACVAVPAEEAVDAVAACGQKGARAVLIVSPGPTGDTRWEEDLVRTARRFGMRLVGPDSTGAANTNPSVGLNAQYGSSAPPPGRVAIGAQSGSLGLAILTDATRFEVGVSSFISLGTAADVTANDALIYWEEDPLTDVIVLYVESFGNPRRFGRLARRVSRSKPIVVVKGGRTRVQPGSIPAQLDLPSVPEAAVDALFHTSGVIRTETLTEMFDVACLLANQPLPLGRRVAVVASDRGPGMLAAGAVAANGLDLTAPSPSLQATLSALRVDTTDNPFVVAPTASTIDYAGVLEALASSHEIDALVAVTVARPATSDENLIEALTHLDAGHVTTLAVTMGLNGQIAARLAGGVPCYAYPEPAMRALTAGVRYAEWRDKPEGAVPEFAEIERSAAANVIRTALSRMGPEGGHLMAEETEQLFDTYGISLLAGSVVGDEDEAVARAAGVEGPVAVKAINPHPGSRAELGGIALGVEGESAVRSAYRLVCGNVPDSPGAIVQPFVEGGHDVVVSMNEDPVFGALIVFGMGGALAQAAADVSFRINPLSDLDVSEMIGELKSSRVLHGYRGGEAGDIPALEDLVLRTSNLIEHHPEIARLELDPIRVLEPGAGATVLDARVYVRPVPGGFLPSRKDVPGRML